MRTLYPLRMLFIFVLLLLWSCSSPTKSGTRTAVNIDDVWLEAAIDNDDDGFASDVRLYFKLSVTISRLEVFVKIGIRECNPLNPEDYVQCLESGAWKCVSVA